MAHRAPSGGHARIGRTCQDEAARSPAIDAQPSPLLPLRNSPHILRLPALSSPAAMPDALAGSTVALTGNPEH